MNASKYLLVCLLCCYGSCAVSAAADSLVRSQQVTVKSPYSEKINKAKKTLQNQKACPEPKQELDQEKTKKLKKNFEKTKKPAFSRMFGLLLPDNLRGSFY